MHYKTTSADAIATNIKVHNTLWIKDGIEDGAPLVSVVTGVEPPPVLDPVDDSSDPVDEDDDVDSVDPVLLSSPVLELLLVIPVEPVEDVAPVPDPWPPMVTAATCGVPR